MAVSAFLPLGTPVHRCNCIPDEPAPPIVPIHSLDGAVTDQLFLAPYVGGALVALAVLAHLAGAVRTHHALVHASLALLLAVMFGSEALIFWGAAHDPGMFILLLPWLWFFVRAVPVFTADRTPLWRIARLCRIGGTWCTVALLLSLLGVYRPHLGFAISAVALISLAIAGRAAEAGGTVTNRLPPAAIHR
jgi:hypothetical protein